MLYHDKHIQHALLFHIIFNLFIRKIQIKYVLARELKRKKKAVGSYTQESTFMITKV